jgi:hypothetical protein
MSTVVDVMLQRETVTVRFHDFCNLPTGCKKAIIYSPEFLCMGHRWKVQIDRGVHGSHDDWLGVFLRASDAYTEPWLFSLKVTMPGNKTYEASGQISPGRNSVHGDKEFAKLTAIEQSLVNGTLAIEVAIWTLGGSDMQVFVPKNPFINNMIKLLTDEESSDVAIQVGGKLGMNGNKRAKTSPTIFHAHKLVLRQCAPQLFQMCRDAREVPINNIKPEVFRHLLHYIYGGTVREDDLKCNAKDIIDAANMTGVVSLKLEAEACYVQSTTITIGNMVDNLQYANSKHLFLLKEAVMDFVANNSAEVGDLLQGGGVPVDIHADLMKAVYLGAGGPYASERVSRLRARLEERGLEFDGSREAMIATLRKNDIERLTIIATHDWSDIIDLAA